MGSTLRYLGLDVGSRRIGVAVSDELGLTAQPVLTLERGGSPRTFFVLWRDFAGASAWRGSLLETLFIFRAS